MVKTEAKGAGLLHYSCQPFELETGEQQTLVITAASNPAGVIQCDEIAVSFTSGEEMEDLFAQGPVAPTVSSDSPYWNICDSKVEELAASKQFTFTFQCVDAGKTLIDYDVVFRLHGVVNSKAGNSSVKIRENSAPEGSEDWAQRTTSLVQPKKQAALYLKNLVAASPDAPLVPRMAFKNGEAVNLTWESNATAFKLYCDDSSSPIYQGSDTHFQLGQGMADTSAFLLEASRTVNEGRLDARTEILYANITLKVTNPDLNFRNVTCTGTFSSGQAAVVSVLNGQYIKLDFGGYVAAGFYVNTDGYAFCRVNPGTYRGCCAYFDNGPLRAALCVDHTDVWYSCMLPVKADSYLFAGSFCGYSGEENEKISVEQLKGLMDDEKVVFYWVPAGKGKIVPDDTIRRLPIEEARALPGWKNLPHQSA